MASEAEEAGTSPSVEAEAEAEAGGRPSGGEGEREGGGGRPAAAAVAAAGTRDEVGGEGGARKRKRGADDDDDDADDDVGESEDGEGEGEDDDVGEGKDDDDDGDGAPAPPSLPPFPPKKKPSRITFHRCGTCDACLRPDCGSCPPCLANKDRIPPPPGTRGRRSRSCDHRPCLQRVSKDKTKLRVVVRAAPGPLGLAVAFPPDGGPPVVADVDAAVCPFADAVRKGDLLLTVAGRGIREAKDLRFRKKAVRKEREVVLARAIAIPEHEKKRHFAKPPDVWATARAARLFGMREGDDVRGELTERIELLKKVNRERDGYKLVLEEGADEKQPLKAKEVAAIRRRAMFLSKAYLIALERMDVASFAGWREAGRLVTRKECKTDMCTWDDCCQRAVDDLNALGIDNYTTGASLAQLNRTFSKKKILMKTEGLRKAHYSDIFEHYPLAKEMIQTFVKRNKKCMSVKILIAETANTILPTVLRHAEERGDDPDSPGYKLLAKVAANPPKEQTMLNWIAHLGLEYDKYCMRRGKEWSEKHKEPSKRYFADPEIRRNHSLKMKEYYRNNPKPKKASNDALEDPNDDYQDYVALQFGAV